MNRQERVAYNTRKRKITAYKIIALAVVCVLCSSVLYYYQGYKNRGWIAYTGVALAGIGYIILFFVVNITFLTAKKIVYKKNKVAWFKQFAIKCGIFGITIFVTVAYCIGIGRLTDQRINHILNDEPTNTTVAFVTDIEQHQSRSGTYHVAIIKYQVNGTEYQKEIREVLGEFQIGEKLTLKYSIEYPEMFGVYHN